MKLLPKEVIKRNKSVIKKVLVALVYANQNICLQQACEQTGVSSHSKHILNHFKSFSLNEIKEFFFHSSLAMLKRSKQQINLRYLKLDVDITEEDYYGKLDNPLNLDDKTQVLVLEYHQRLSQIDKLLKEVKKFKEVEGEGFKLKY
jgi:hypothetical protein